jgi:transcriptional regulator with XRE-family HTH domain
MKRNVKRYGPHPVDVHVGRRVRARRVLAGMSQTALADELGLTFQQLQKYESGANRIAASRLYRTAIVLEVPVQFFFMGLEGVPEDGEGGDAGVAPRRATLNLVRDVGRCAPDLQKQVRGLVRAIADHAAAPPAE